MRKSQRSVLLLMVPALLLYLVLFVIPSAQAIWYSMQDWSGFGGNMQFIGLGNYRELALDPVLRTSIRKTAELLFYGGAGIFVLALFFTFLLSQGVRGKNVFRTLIYFPNMVASVALSVLWGVFILHNRFGILNGLLRLVGLDSLILPWMGPKYMFNSATVAMVWSGVGFYIILMVSGIDKIPQDFYDAAKVAGANTLQTYFMVSLPMVRDVLAVAVIHWCIRAVKAFEFLNIFAGGNETPVTMWTTAVYAFTMAFGSRQPIYRLGFSAAISVFLLIIVLFTSVGLRKLLVGERIEY